MSSTACNLPRSAFVRKMGAVPEDSPSPARDAFFMRRALDLARNALGDTHPNPLVGAVVVKDGRIIGEGWHKRAGGPHAEVHALAATGDAARGATLYVTLEPCSTFGRTPPCTEAILRAGIARVVVGATDPNPQHAGRAYGILREAGVAVTEGVLAADCGDANLIFNHRMRKNVPLFAGKVALSLDGRMAARTGNSQWITGDSARRHAHMLRRYYPAIGVGSGTVLADNPHLTARLPETPEFCPQRFVFDRTLRTAAGELPALYGDAFSGLTTVVHGPAAPAERLARLTDAGVNLLQLDSVDAAFWNDFSAFLASREIWGILIEGGAGILRSLSASGRMDYLYAYRAPLLFSDEQALSPFAGEAPDSPAQCARLTDVRHEVFGDDDLVRGWISPGVAK